MTLRQTTSNRRDGCESGHAGLEVYRAGLPSVSRRPAWAR